MTTQSAGGFLHSFRPSRRGLLTGAAVAIALPLLASCAPAGGSAQVFGQPAGKLPSQYEGRRRIVFWNPWGGENNERILGYVQEFHDSQDEIYVEAQLQEGYDGTEQKFLAALQAKEVPDVIGLGDMSWPRFYLNDTLEPLGGYFGGDFTEDAIHPVLLEEGKVRGELYWLSYGRSTPLFYYNRDAFSKIGLPDRAPETWDELREWGKEINGFSYNGSPMKVRSYSGSDDWYIQGNIWSFGGAISRDMDITVAEAEAVAALEFDRALIHDDKAAYLSEDFTGDFATGMVATVTTSTGSLTGLTQNAQFEIGTGFLPKGPGGSGVPTGGGGLAIPKNADPENKKAAFEFMKFLSTGSRTIDWTLGTGYMPPTKEAMESPEFQTKLKENPNYGVSIEQLEIAKLPDPARRFVPETIQELRRVIQAVYADNADPATELGKAAETIAAAAESVKPQYDAKVKA